MKYLFKREKFTQTIEAKNKKNAIEIFLTEHPGTDLKKYHIIRKGYQLDLFDPDVFEGFSSVREGLDYFRARAQGG